MTFVIEKRIKKNFITLPHNIRVIQKITDKITVTVIFCMHLADCSTNDFRVLTIFFIDLVIFYRIDYIFVCNVGRNNLIGDLSVYPFFLNRGKGRGGETRRNKPSRLNDKKNQFSGILRCSAHLSA